MVPPPSKFASHCSMHRKLPGPFSLLCHLPSTTHPTLSRLRPLTLVCHRLTNPTMALLHALLFCLLMATTPLSAAQSCQPDHQLCSPEGLTSYEIPINWSSSGPLMADFYEDLVYTVNRQPSKQDQHAKVLRLRSASSNLCCRSLAFSILSVNSDHTAGTTNTQCLLLEKFFVAFCWVSLPAYWPKLHGCHN